jgi:hydroxyacylglutathione hydrolase
MIEIEHFACRTDNFGVILHDPASGQTASIDAPEAEAVISALARRGWALTHVLSTHHHPDHVEGNLALKAKFGCTIIGPAAEAAQIPGIDVQVKGGNRFLFGRHAVDVIDTPGHTLGQIAYHLPGQHLLFAADCLFSLGCGRLFEGTAAMMWASLQRLMALPPETTLYCGHEYSAANARFALSVDPDNPALQARAAEITRLQAANLPTLPVKLSSELAANPFLRPHDPAIRARLGKENANIKHASDAEVFAQLRLMKDRF